MKLQEAIPCPNCERLAQRVARLEDQLHQTVQRIARLEEENTQLPEENARLRAENAQLHQEIARVQQQLAAARKDSSTSSKPPSTDIVKPKKPLPPGGQKRKKGGQPGHEQHLRCPFPPEAVDHFQCYTLDYCPHCVGRFSEGTGSGVGAGDPTGHHRCAGGPGDPQPGQAVPRERGGLLPLHHHAGG